MEDLFKKTGTNNEEELANYIDELKKEKTAARGAATKANNAVESLTTKLEELQKELDGTKADQAELEKEVGELEEEIKVLRQKEQSTKSEMTKKVKEKALAVMKQTGVEKVFVSEDGNVFLNENKAKNHSKGRYKVATMLEDDKVKIR